MNVVAKLLQIVPGTTEGMTKHALFFDACQCIFQADHLVVSCRCRHSVIPGSLIRPHDDGEPSQLRPNFSTGLLVYKPIDHWIPVLISATNDSFRLFCTIRQTCHEAQTSQEAENRFALHTANRHPSG